MSLVRKLYAECDATDILSSAPLVTRDCFTSMSLNPDDTQPYLSLVHKGWRIKSLRNEIRLVCPKHNRKEDKDDQEG